MPHQIIKLRLENEGFDGLYLAGECACLKDDLAPCGCDTELDDAGWINGCCPGYKHNDSRLGHEGEWAIGSTKNQMCADSFAALGI